LPAKTKWRQWKKPLESSAFRKVGFQIQVLVKMGIEDSFNSKPNFVDLINLIRSIQRAEGNIDCYRRGLIRCDRMDCVWRDHCLKGPERHSKIDSESLEHEKAANAKQEKDSSHQKLP
jgi:hypothetical protein